MHENSDPCAVEGVPLQSHREPSVASASALGITECALSSAVTLDFSADPMSALTSWHDCHHREITQYQEKRTGAGVHKEGESGVSGAAVGWRRRQACHIRSHAIVSV